MCQTSGSNINRLIELWNPTIKFVGELRHKSRASGWAFLSCIDFLRYDIIDKEVELFFKVEVMERDRNAILISVMRDSVARNSITRSKPSTLITALVQLLPLRNHIKLFMQSLFLAELLLVLITMERNLSIYETISRQLEDRLVSVIVRVNSFIAVGCLFLFTPNML